MKPRKLFPKDRVSLLYITLLQMAELTEAVLSVHLPDKEVTLYARKGYLLKTTGGLPLWFFLNLPEYKQIPDEEVVEQCLVSGVDIGKIALAVLAQSASTLMALPSLVFSASKGRMEIHAASGSGNSIWKWVDGGLALRKEVVDIFLHPYLTPPPSPKEYLLEPDLTWEDPFPSPVLDPAQTSAQGTGFLSKPEAQ